MAKTQVTTSALRETVELLAPPLPTNENHTGTFVTLCDWFMGTEREKGDPGTGSKSRWVMQGHCWGGHVLGDEEEEGVVLTHTCFACLVLSQAHVKPSTGRRPAAQNKTELWTLCRIKKYFTRTPSPRQKTSHLFYSQIQTLQKGASHSVKSAREETFTVQNV